MKTEGAMTELFCDSTMCTKRLRPSGEVAYHSRVPKLNVLETEFRPGKYSCPDCSSMLIPNKKRKSVVVRNKR